MAFSLQNVLIVCFCVQAVSSAAPQMVIYWGQNSAGSFTNVPSEQEKPLRSYCEDSRFDIIVVGFVYLFPSAPGNSDPTLPGMNFANHCEVPFNDANPFVLNCTANVAPDIKFCQQRGKTILLSFGGGIGPYGFNTDAQGITFAETVWNMFLGGSGRIRPFGDAIFDGVDLDIEGGTTVGWTPFVKTLRNYFATSSKKYYISSAPQCFFPDRLGPGTGTPLTDAWFDYIWIQFYNNHCGLQSYPTATFNFAQWASSFKNAANPNVKLFIGAPASPLAAASGFVPLSTLQKISTAIANTYPEIYGGMMVWDTASSDLNDDFGGKVAAFTHSQNIPSLPTPVSPTPSIAPVPASPTPAPAAPTPAPSQPSTTDRPAPSTTGANAASSTGPSTSCSVGEMKCLSDTTYSMCDRNKWAVAQSCGVGTVCEHVGNVIYCIAGNPSAPSAPVTPIPISPSATGSAMSSTGATSTDSCTLGYQRCVGKSTYQTCGHGVKGPTWASPQECQAGFSCHPSSTANNIYCY